MFLPSPGTQRSKQRSFLTIFCSDGGHDGPGRPNERQEEKRQMQSGRKQTSGKAEVGAQRISKETSELKHHRVSLEDKPLAYSAVRRDADHG